MARFKKKKFLSEVQVCSLTLSLYFILILQQNV